MINTCSYSYAALAYTENVDKVIALLESTSGIGCVCGPVIGSFVYGLVGFQWTFAGFGIAMAPASLLVMLLKSPGEIKNNDIEEEDEPIEATTLILPGAP